jgi:prevent-host-death family protein
MPKMVDATSAKNRFGEILRMAEKEPVYIVRHGKAKTVVLAADHFEALQQKIRGRDGKVMDELRHEFDALHTAMQQSSWHRGVDRLLKAPAEELNRISARRIRARARKSR